MLYEPYKKRSYRFPSAKSITEIDSKLYFPEKHPFTDESVRYDNRNNYHVPERESFRDL